MSESGLGASSQRRFPRKGSASFWALVLVLGQAATLALIDAGPRVHYQHVRPFGEWLTVGRGLPVALLMAQLAAVLVGVWRRRALLMRFELVVKRRQAALVAGIFFLSSATLSPSASTYGAELVAASALQLLHLLTAALFALDLDAGALSWLQRSAERMSEAGSSSAPSEPRADRLGWLLAGGVTLLAAGLSVWSYQRHPHVPDEVAYYLQARYFAAGLGSLPAPAVPEAFETYLLWVVGGRWVSPFPPAWPALLAVGFVLRVPWMVNALLAGLNVVLAQGLLRQFYPRRVARLASVLLALSPWSLFLAMSWMSHTSSLTATLLAARAVARMRRSSSAAWGLPAGAAIGWVSLTRPLESVIVAGGLGLWSLGARGRRLRFFPTLVFAAATLATVSLNLSYNRLVTGSATRFPVHEYMEQMFGRGTNRLGFGADRGPSWEGADPFPGHGALDVLVNVNLNVFQLNTELLGWAAGSLLPVAAFIVIGRLRRADRWMVFVIGSVVAVQALYWYPGGSDFGARYWYLCAVPLAALSARGIDLVAEKAARRGTVEGLRVYAAVALLSAASLLVFVPWRAADKYHRYRGMRPDLRTLAAVYPWHDALVAIQGEQHPDYASAVVYNPLDPSGPGPLFVRDRGHATRERLIEAFPARRAWIVSGPSLTGGAYRVVAGPLSAEEFLAYPEPSTRQSARSDGEGRRQ